MSSLRRSMSSVRRSTFDARPLMFDARRSVSHIRCSAFGIPRSTFAARRQHSASTFSIQHSILNATRSHADAGRWTVDPGGPAPLQGELIAQSAAYARIPGHAAVIASRLEAGETNLTARTRALPATSCSPRPRVTRYRLHTGHTPRTSRRVDPSDPFAYAYAYKHENPTPSAFASCLSHLGSRSRARRHVSGLRVHRSRAYQISVRRHCDGRSAYTIRDEERVLSMSRVSRAQRSLSRQALRQAGSTRRTAYSVHTHAHHRPSNHSISCTQPQSVKS